MPESTKLRPGRPTEIRFPLLRKSILSTQKPSEASGKFISRLKTYTSKLEIQLFRLEICISSLEIQLFTQFIHFSNGRPEEISPQSSLFQITPAGFVPGRRPRRSRINSANQKALRIFRICHIFILPLYYD